MPLKTLSPLLVATLLASCGTSAPSGPPRPTSERTIECAGSGSYTAEFIPGAASNPVDNWQVTFTKKPTSTEAEAALRRCIDAASRTVRIDYETLVNAWFNEDGPLPLSDGSDHLAYDPKTGKVQTWNEREGVKPSQTKREGYTVEYQEDKILVPPYGKFATLDVLFEKPPAQAEIVTILTREVASALDKQSTKLDTTAYAKSGPATDRAAQKQVRGSSGVFLNVRFDAKSGQVRDQDRRLLRTIK